jgi:uncharacterized protein (DUF58 family)
MLTVEETRQLDRLTLGAFGVSPISSAAGARLARVRGIGLEFHDYRGYQPGDDPRRIDWTVHARLQQLVVRVCRSDAHLRIHLLVDTSGSMGIGTPDKLSCAKKIAAFLSYVAVKRRDAVGVAAFDGTIRRRVAPATGRSQLLRVFEALGAVTPQGYSTTNHALRDYGLTVRGPGLAVVVSDFFQEGGAFEGLRYLLHRGLTPAVVQVVASEELNPAFDEAELVDVENPQAAPLVVDARAIAAYRKRMADLSAHLGAFCHEHGLPCMRVESSSSSADLLRATVQAGLLASQGEAGRA